MYLMGFYFYTCWIWPFVFVCNLIKAIHLYPKTEKEETVSMAHYAPIIWASIALFFMTAIPFCAIIMASL